MIPKPFLRLIFSVLCISALQKPVKTEEINTGFLPTRQILKENAYLCFKFAPLRKQGNATSSKINSIQIKKWHYNAVSWDFPT